MYRQPFQYSTVEQPHLSTEESPRALLILLLKLLPQLAVPDVDGEKEHRFYVKNRQQFTYTHVVPVLSGAMKSLSTLCTKQDFFHTRYKNMKHILKIKRRVKGQRAKKKKGT